MDSIEITDLTKKFGDKIAVDNLNLTIKKDELFSLLGVNGAGKTTTIKILSGLIKSTSGMCKIFGNNVNADMDKIKPIINISPQETSIAPNLTVKENLYFMAGIYNVPKCEREERVLKIIKDFSLNDVLNKKTKNLSGGWQRRLSIAMALISQPKILFLDEPTLGLDVIARRELWRIIEEIKKTTTIILTTHYMEEAEILSDRVGIMKDGVLLEVATPKELIKKMNAKNFEDAFVKVIEGEK